MEYVKIIVLLNRDYYKEEDAWKLMETNYDNPEELEIALDDLEPEDGVAAATYYTLKDFMIESHKESNYSSNPYFGELHNMCDYWITFVNVNAKNI